MGGIIILGLKFSIAWFFHSFSIEVGRWVCCRKGMKDGWEERCRICLFSMVYDISSSYESVVRKIEFQVMLLCYVKG